MRVRVEGLREEEAERRARAERLLRFALQLDGEVEDRLGLGGATRSEICRRSRPASETSVTVLTTSAPSPRRPRRRRRGRRGARRRRLERAVAHRRGDLLVRVAERNALADERLGGVGRAQQRVGRRGGEPRRGRTRARATSTVERAERAGDVAPRGEHRRLVLLQVAVVRERQPLHRREQPGRAGRSRCRPCRARARRRPGSASAASSTSRSPRPRAAARSRTPRVVQSTSSSPIRERCVKRTAAA